MYETNLFFKLKGGEKDKNNNKFLSQKANIKLKNKIVGAKYLEIVIASVSNRNDYVVIASSSIVENSNVYTNTDDERNIYKKVFKSSYFQLIKNSFKRIKIPINEKFSNIENFDIELTLLNKDQSFATDELEQSFIHLIIHHTES